METLAVQVEVMPGVWVNNNSGINGKDIQGAKSIAMSVARVDPSKSVRIVQQPGDRLVDIIPKSR